MNALLEGRRAAREWLERLDDVSTTLYEVDVAAWEQFEPARKKVAEAVSWLDRESEIDLGSSSVSAVLAVMQRKLPEVWRRWNGTAGVAVQALGTAVLDDLLHR